MPNVAIRGVLARLCLGLAEVQPDAELLENYIANRDEAAFALLVQRHGPKVFAVCRRLLGQHQLAEDAYQATFVVLAKKAHTIQPRSAVGGFLYGVARKAALEAYAVSRRRKETLVENVPDSPAATLAATDSDVLAMLDEEIANLSDAYRAAVVLCELDGVGRTEAARQLGIAEGTLSSRLAAARKQLATRLKARGVVFSAGLMSSLALSANAAIPPAFASATTAVSLIATGVLRTMLLAKFKIVTTVCILVTALIGMSSFVPKSSMEAIAAPVPKVEKDEGLLWTQDAKTGTLAAFTLDGKKERELKLKAGRNFQGISANGETLLFLAKKGQLTEDEDGLTLHLGKPNDLAGATDTGIECSAKDHFYFLLTRDKKRVVRIQNARNGTDPPVNRALGLPSFNHTLIDLATKKETAIELTDHMQIVDETHDGKEWIAMEYNTGEDLKRPGNRYLRIPMNGGKPVPICDTHQFPFFVPSPNGETYLGLGVSLPPKGELKGFTLYHFNPKTGKATEREVFTDTEQRNVIWSPDGKRFAMKKLGDADLYIGDIDGTKLTKSFAIPDAGPETYLIGWFAAKQNISAPVPKIEIPKQQIRMPLPKVKPPEGVIVLSSFRVKNQIEIVKPDGVSYRMHNLARSIMEAKLSPDGKRMAFVEILEQKPVLVGQKPNTGWVGMNICCFDLDAKEPEVQTIAEGVHNAVLSWAPNGRLYFSHIDPDKLEESQKPGVIVQSQTWSFDFAAKKKTQVKLPSEQIICDISPDGKSLLTRTLRWNTMKQSLYRTPLDTLEPQIVIDEQYPANGSRFSPDGKRVLLTRVTGSVTDASVKGVYVLDLATRKESQIRLPKELEASAFYKACWNPDGTRIAICWFEAIPQPRGAPIPIAPPGGPAPQWAATRITVCDADGANAKTIVKREYNETITGLQWAAVTLEPEKPGEERQKEPISAPVPKGREEVIVAYHAGRPVLLNENGKVVRELFAEGWGGSTGRATLSPDGRQIAMLTDTKRDATGWMFRKLYLRDVDGKGNGEELMPEGLEALTAIWSPDGKSLYTSGYVTKKTIVDGKKNPNYTSEAAIHHRIDIASKKRTELTLPAGHQIMDVSPDGKWFLTHVPHMHNAKETYKVCLVGMDGTVRDDLTDGSAPIVGQRFSPDGKKVVALSFNDVDNRTAVRLSEAFILDVAAKEKMVVLPLSGLHDNAIVQSVAWSPDGSRIAFSWWTDGRTKGEPKDTLAHVSIATFDNAKIRTIFSVKDKTMGSIDWAKTRVPVAVKPEAKPSAELLVPKLGSGVFAEREAAQKELRALGLAALPALKIGLQSSDPEIVLRCETLIDRIGKDDAEAFAKAFLADKDYTKTFDHAIWTRWAKRIGDNHGSRELFAEMLSADGAAVALAYMADAKTKDAAERYRSILTRLKAQAEPRYTYPQKDKNLTAAGYTHGEAAFCVYLGTFAGTEKAFPDPEKDHGPSSTETAPFDGISHWPGAPVSTLETSRMVEFSGNDWKSPGVQRWKRMEKSARILFVESMTNRKDPHTIERGLQIFSGKPNEILPVAISVVNNKNLPRRCLAPAIQILGKCGATEYLDTIAESETDSTMVERFGSNVGGKERRFSYQVRDVAIGVRLILHKQSLVDYGYVYVTDQTDEPNQGNAQWQLGSIINFSFPDEASRTAAHTKALAFLKTAKKPEPEAPNRAK